MAECVNCGDEFSDKRAELGYNTCLDCGHEDAKIQAEIKTTKIGPAYNKGNYMYLGDNPNPKDFGK